jgi:hypothetical protein
MSISSKIVPDTLAKRNFHPRDEFITFDILRVKIYNIWYDHVISKKIK